MATTEQVQQAAREMLDVFLRNGLTYPQAIHMMAAATKMIGKKSGMGEATAAIVMVDDLLKLMPDMLSEIS